MFVLHTIPAIGLVSLKDRNVALAKIDNAVAIGQICACGITEKRHIPVIPDDI